MEPITREETYLSAIAGGGDNVPEPITRRERYLKAILDNGGGGGGTSDYSALSNKPQINGVELSGNKTAAALGVPNATDIAPIFDDATNYSKNDLVYYDGALYEFQADHTAGAWDSSEVIAKDLSDILSARVPDANPLTAEQMAALLALI